MMMKVSKTLALVLFVAMATLPACNKDNDNDPCGNNFNWGLELQAEATAISNAATAYAMDQTTQNCEDYRAAIQAYLDAAADLDGCVVASERAAYEQAIVDAQAELNALSC